MTSSHLATVEIKAFVAARDFERSMEFYQALGFTRASVGVLWRIARNLPRPESSGRVES